MANNCGIYKITNTVTGDFYIGSSSDVRKRIWLHRHTLSNGTHHNPHLQSVWNKYGEQSFDFTVILLCDIEHKLYFEQGLLDLLKPVYNIAVCATAPWQGLHHSDETKRKISKIKKGTRMSEDQKHKMSEVNIGKHHTDETKRKMSEDRMGHVTTEETRAKISKSLKGKHPSDEALIKMGAWQIGKHLSEETKHKMSEAQKLAWAKRKANA